ncbi:MAG: hydroxymethylglutaryl-CoA reductase (NADPH) [Candidatus Diapherotrites archaeon]|nr:hydroxymethylglutaryl-CoA reductase (NADPH) [Candidatus Diapherotrites archaeon]
MPVDKAVKERIKAVEKMSGAKLTHISHYSIDEEETVKKNIENMIGVTQVPLGVAGPLKVNGKEYIIPLATTEGALVASVNRGCKTINLSGGAKATVVDNRMTRAPVFSCESASKAVEAAMWIDKSFDEIKKLMEEDPFLKLLKVRSWVVGRNLYTRFECFTGDAMGMNMITIGVEKVCKYIEENTGAKWLATSGNMCIDKKPSALNMIEGRGRRVIAECVIPEKVVREVLKTTPDAMIEVNYRKNLVGSAQAGSYGFNAHFANIVAAMYIATGQDPAQVVSGSMGFTLIEKKGNDIHASVTVPCLKVATVGGGTQRETQSEALDIMGLRGGGKPAGANADKLAEVMASAILAGELSLVAALAAKHLGRAHSQLGR